MSEQTPISASTLPKRHMEVMLKMELPKQYQKPDVALMRATARQRRCRPGDVQWKVALISMECGLAKEYDQWFNSQEGFIREWAVPHMILSREEYAEKTGHTQDERGQAAAAKKYMDGFNTLHRPPNWAVMLNVKGEGERPNV